MQEPKRFNLFQIVQKNLEIANRRSFIHRVVYIFPTQTQNPDFWLNTLKDLIKSSNEGNLDNPLVGMGIFYPGYVINALEGTEDFLIKHIDAVVKVVSEENTMLKIIVYLPHIDKKLFAVWRGVVLNPPTGSQPPPTMTQPSHHGSLVKQCVLQLFKLFELLNEHYELDSKQYNQHLPDVLILDALLSSPLLLSGEDIVEKYKAAPRCPIYHEQVWPPPPDFVPKKILPD